MDQKQSQNNSPGAIQAGRDVNINSPVIEQSLVGDVIREILEIRVSHNRSNIEQSEAYTIEEKIEKNKIKPLLSNHLIGDHYKNFAVIEKSLRNISSTVNPLVFDDIFDFYSLKYTEVLDNMGITKEKKIVEQSSEIFKSITELVFRCVFEGKSTDIKTEHQEMYVFSLTNYIFYRCKILVRV